MSINLNSKIRRRFISSGMMVCLLLLFACQLSYAYTLKARAQYLPWSGWWWPLSQGKLVLGYNGHPSPSEKYDLYSYGNYPRAATREAKSSSDKQVWFNPDGNAWMGFCNGWVNASIQERYEIKPSSRNGVFFTIGDKKGLLSACHVNDEILYEFCQQSPEPFHRYLLKYVGEEGGIIGADLDSTTAFWSYPIYAYEMNISEGQKSDIVECKITFADDFVDPDYVGTKIRSRTYRYRLNKDDDGSYSGSGEWLQGDEWGLHPQMVWIPIGVNQDKLFVDYAEVKAIAESVDDEQEGDKLIPGHHLIMVYPQEKDQFNLTPQVGESIECKIALDPQNVKANGALLRLLKNGAVIKEDVLTSELEHISIASDTGTDHFTLQIEPLPDNSVGACVHLYVDVEADYVRWFYGVPSDDYWFGCATVSEGQSSAARAWLVPVGSGNLPIGRGARSGGGMDNSGQWLDILENQQTVDYFSNDARPVALKIVSNQPNRSLFLVGSNLKLWGGAGDALESAKATRLAIPWLTSSFDMYDFATLYLVNNLTEVGNFTIKYYRNNGKSSGTVVDYSLLPESINRYKVDEYPGLNGGVDGWAVIEADGGGLSGKVELKEGYGRVDQLPLLQFSRVAYMPHLVKTDEWKTVLGVCNPGSEPLSITLTAYLDGGMVSQKYAVKVDPFAKYELELNGAYFGLTAEQFNRAWVIVEGDADFGSFMRFLYETKSAASISLPLNYTLNESRKLPQLAITDGWWTGVVLLNPESHPLAVNLSVLNGNGKVEQAKTFTIPAYGKFTESIASFFEKVDVDKMATLHLEGEGTGKIKALVVYGAYDANLLAMMSW